MSLMTNEYADRLDHWLRVLKQDLYRPAEEIQFEAFTTMDYLTPEEAAKGNFKPYAFGTKWGRKWEYMWVRAEIAIPDSCAGQIVAIDIDTDCEASLFVNGKAFGTHRADWITQPHHYICDNFITESAVPGTRYSLLFEIFSGHYFKDEQPGPIIPDGSFPPKYDEGKLATIESASFGIWNEDAYQLYLDMYVLSDLLDSIDQNSLRASHIADGLEEATRVCDFEQDQEGRNASYRAARQVLKPLMEAENGSTAPRMFAVGNSHIDLAWRWPLDETYRKTERTFAAQLRLLDKYPDYVYLQSQPASYEMVRKNYPELYERIKAAVKEGRWIPEGAMYVEPDTNMASGEALIRQLTFGKKFFREEFGVDSRMMWLPDTFGYSAALPQILQGCGVKYLVTQKTFWSYNNSEPFPYHYFSWVGMDGSKVSAYLPTSYTYPTNPAELNHVWNSRVQKRDLDDFLIPFGYGDGGGGPCRDHIEMVEREKNLEGMPKVEMGNPVDFFDELEEKGGPKHSYTGELYLTTHRGTLTSQALIKRNNRKSELALRDMEIWGVFSAMKGNPYDYDTAEKLWKTLLLNQFHDILPGSSIERVYEEANAAHSQLQKDAEKITTKSRVELTEANRSVTLFNSLSFPRTEVVTMPDCFGDVATADGQELVMSDHQVIVTVPAMGWVTLYPEGCGRNEAAATLTEDESGFTMVNDAAAVKINREGEVTSYIRDGREFAAEPMNVFRLYKDVPRKYDAWDLDSNYRQLPVDISGGTTIEVLRSSGATVSLKMTKKFSNSVINQVITLDIDGVLKFETDVDWHERHRVLKVAFPVDVKSLNAIHEIQFGYIERPTHRSREYDRDRYEVCNHRYTALQDGSHGAAVLNDCKYGVGVEGNSIELTLLRGSMAPDYNADQGEQVFTYAFDAWNCPFIDSPVTRDGLRLNVPVTQQCGEAETFSGFQIDRGNVIIDTVKPADDRSEDIVLRIYEACNADTSFTLATSLPVKEAFLCDMLENNPEKLDGTSILNLHVKPFEIKTLRLKLQ